MRKNVSRQHANTLPQATSALPRLPSFRAPRPAQPADVAFLQFTSGSTSQPKGVVVTHAALAHNCALVRRQMGVGAGDCEVSWLPQYHGAPHLQWRARATTLPTYPTYPHALSPAV